MRGLGLPERRPDPYPDYREFREMAIIRNLHLGQWLIEYAIQVLPMLEAPLRNRFLNCSRPQQQSVPARMYGFEKFWGQMCPWTRDEFMHMLLNNE
jgi:hypothetical protein